MTACKIDVTVRVMRSLTGDISLFELVPLDGARLPAFTAGSHIDVEPSPGIVRQYSLCNGPHETDCFVIAVKRVAASRGGSAAMHRLRAGSRLRIGAPRNAFALRESGSTILVGAGIGITPLLSMARHLHAHRRRFTLHYFARPGQLAFEPELAQLRDHGEISLWAGLERHQIRMELVSAIGTAPADACVYACGPAGFMSLVAAESEAIRPQMPLLFERFEAAPVDAAVDSAFRLRLCRAGVEFDVPAGESIVQALLARGIRADTCCEAGMCGTCVTAVVDGVPLHRDSFLNDEEKAAGRSMCICVSRSLSPVLALDL